MAYYLEPGHHELTIRQREDGTQLDRILITSDPSYVPYDVQMEAESGALSWPMRATNYFANNYVWVPNGSKKGGSVSYNLNLPADGQFLLWGRVNAPTSGDDSFFVSIDSGASNLWDTTRTSSTGWAWDIVSDRYTGDAMFDLSAGSHVLRVRRREDGAKLDQLILTNDLGFTPVDPALDLSEMSSQPL
jgi:hypothetical protein